MEVCPNQSARQTKRRRSEAGTPEGTSLTPYLQEMGFHALQKPVWPEQIRKSYYQSAGLWKPNYRM